MTETLTSVMTPTHLGRSGVGDRFALEVVPGWAQGRGAFGGLVLGAFVRAIEMLEPEPERRLRSLTGELVGPVVVGPCEIEVTALRRGNAVSSYAARLSQGGEVLAAATAVLGRTRDVDTGAWSPRDRVPARAWSAIEPLPARNPYSPEFTQHLEYRLIGPAPMSGATRPEVTGWVRPRAPIPTIGPAELVALADAWWPAVFSTARTPRPIATVAFTLQSLLGDRTLPGDVPLHHRAEAVAARDGFFVEHRELWTEAGQLVALNQQTFVWIK